MLHGKTPLIVNLKSSCNTYFTKIRKSICFSEQGFISGMGEFNVDDLNSSTLFKTMMKGWGVLFENLLTLYVLTRIQMTSTFVRQKSNIVTSVDKKSKWDFVVSVVIYPSSKLKFYKRIQTIFGTLKHVLSVRCCLSHLRSWNLWKYSAITYPNC